MSNYIHPPPRPRGPVDNSHTYLARISNLCTRFPNLALLSIILLAAQPTIRGRIMVLEFNSGAPNLESNADDYVSRHEFSSPNDLAAYLLRTDISPATHQRPSRLFLVEDLVPAYINKLGEYFAIDPAFFAGHLASANWLAVVDKGGAAPRLPSSMPKNGGFKGQKFWTLLFYEMLLFHDPEGLKKHRDIFRDANVYRKVHYGKAAVEWARCGIAHSNASFWSRSRNIPVGDWEGAPIGWDAIMLLDPPTRNNLVTGTYPDRVKLPELDRHTLFQGGYVDFRPLSQSGFRPGHDGMSCMAPDRTSLLDDIVFYWTSNHDTLHQDIKSAIRDPSGAKSAKFLKRIVASNWVVMLEYLKQTICQLEYELEDHRGTGEAVSQKGGEKAQTNTSLSTLERNLSSTHMWRRRCAHYHEQMHDNCRALGFDPQKPGPPHAQSNDAYDHDEEGWDYDTEGDLIFIMGRLSEWRQRAEALVGVLMSQLSILESQKSFVEAQGVTRLTVLGLFFIPLSLLAAIFSMGGNFQPGEKNFWMFFVFGLLLVGLVFLLAFGVRGLFMAIKKIMVLVGFGRGKKLPPSVSTGKPPAPIATQPQIHLSIVYTSP